MKHLACRARQFLAERLLHRHVHRGFRPAPCDVLCWVLSGLMPAPRLAVAAEQPEKTSATISRSFEVRHVSTAPAADGESDFLGPTSVLGTDRRVEYLRALAATARRFFDNERWDRPAVPPHQVTAALGRLKPQPTPQVRRRIAVDRWRWLGHREGVEKTDGEKLAAWRKQDGLVARGDGTLGFASPATATFAMPAQDWRFLVRMRMRRAADDPRPATLKIGDAVVLDFDGHGRMTADGREAATLAKGAWTDLRFEVALDANSRCFNVDADGNRRLSAGPVGNATKVDRVTFAGSPGWEIGDCWVQAYSPAQGNPQVPIAMATVVDETFRARPSPAGFAEIGYDDSAWHEAAAPFPHGGERHRGEDLYLRQRFDAPKTGRVWLHCETIFPGGEVWLNGRVIHVQHDPKPLRVDVTRFVSRGAANLLAIRVFPFAVARHIAHGPHDKHSGWFAGRTWIDVTADDAIEEMFVTAARLEPTPTLRVRARLNTVVWAPMDSKSKPDPKRKRQLRLRLRPWFPQDGPVAAESVHEAPLAYFGRPVDLDVELPVPNGQLWSPDRPFLYCVEAVLESVDGKPLDDAIATTGLRTVDQHGGVFRLNGRPELLRGGLLFGMRPPLEDQALNLRCAPPPHLVREILLAKAVGGNCIRMAVHEGTYLGCNDPRLVEIGDQLGMCFLWSTTAWVRTASAWQIDLDLLAADAKLVRNHPSIVMWQPGNHPIFFSAADGMAWWRDVFRALVAVDDSRLISPVGGSSMIRPPSDDGRRARDGGATIEPEPTWIHPLAARGDFDCPTGYGKPPGPWYYLRTWPHPPDWDGEFGWTRGGFKREYLDSKTHAFFDFESEETIGQPNWELLRGSPIYRIMSYEHKYDEKSIGRLLTCDEWEVSQAWQALSAGEAYRKKRLLDYDGLFWCCLDGGGNTGTYQKPLTDHLGHAKMAFYAARMAFQPTLAGSGNVDVSYGPKDNVPVRVMHLGEATTVDVAVRLTSIDGRLLAEKTYRDVQLAAGRTVKELPPWKPELPEEGIYVFEYLVFRAGQR
jgi:hypothetical protein